MKCAISLSAFVLLFAFGTRAQDSPQLPSSPVSDTGASAAALKTFASVTLIPGAVLPDWPGGMAAASSSSPGPQGAVQGVRPTYSFQAYGGYTFVRVYAFPGREVNRNGFDLSLSHFFKKGLFGVEGAITGAFGSIGGETSDFAFFGGGPRVRFSGPRGLELWAHGLAGDAHFGPRIQAFTQDAVAYEVGGGVDITAHFQRFAYRVEADMIGSRLYNTAQYSPKVSAGIVYKF